MNEAPRDPLVEFARSLPAALDESALHELADRLQPFLTERQPERPKERLYTAAETAQSASVSTWRPSVVQSAPVSCPSQPA